jgi:hypothetical protein
MAIRDPFRNIAKVTEWIPALASRLEPALGLAGGKTRRHSAAAGMTKNGAIVTMRI